MYAVIFGIVFIAIGCVLLMEGLMIVIKCNKKTTGTLVGVEMHSDYEYRNAKKVCFVPVYSFEVDGKEYSGTAKIYKDKAEDYDIGSTATVRYCPANPKVFTVKNRNGRIGISLIFLVIGIFMCFIR